MKNLTTYLFVMFMAMFWLFRLVVAICFNLGINIGVEPLDLNFEILILFLTLVAAVLIVKRNTLGGVIYLIGNGVYFGTTIFNSIMGENISYGNAFFAFIGILIPVLVLFDLLLDQNRKDHPKDKKTDWFYQNEEFDRKYDERADRNQYKF